MTTEPPAESVRSVRSLLVSGAVATLFVLTLLGVGFIPPRSTEPAVVFADDLPALHPVARDDLQTIESVDTDAFVGRYTIRAVKSGAEAGNATLYTSSQSDLIRGRTLMVVPTPWTEHVRAWETADIWGGYRAGRARALAAGIVIVSVGEGSVLAALEPDEVERVASHLAEGRTLTLVKPVPLAGEAGFGLAE